MRKAKNIFYVITGLYIISSIIFIVARDNFYDKMGVLAYTNFLQYWLIFGIVLFIIMIVLSQIHIRRLQNRNKILDVTVSKLKATLYDIEHKPAKPFGSIDTLGEPDEEKEIKGLNQ
ncbi:MAG: hypothetical protein M3512_10580 [Bacteroidota bacterium]|nr:hypothetical protein [Bacteroidota bacterium]